MGETFAGVDFERGLEAVEELQSARAGRARRWRSSRCAGSSMFDAVSTRHPRREDAGAGARRTRPQPICRRCPRRRCRRSERSTASRSRRRSTPLVIVQRGSCRRASLSVFSSSCAGLSSDPVGCARGSIRRHGVALVRRGRLGRRLGLHLGLAALRDRQSVHRNVPAHHHVAADAADVRPLL